IGSSMCRTTCASTAPRSEAKRALDLPSTGAAHYTALRSMARILGSATFGLMFAASLLMPVASFAGASPVATAALAGTPIKSVYVRAASGANPKTPQQVLVALHGMGGNGEVFGRDLVEQADQYGWLLVAPTIEYGDWKDPNQVAREDPRLIGALLDY